jgi:hypothetical protein
VVDAQGRPIENARVFISEAPGPVPDIAAVTGADGRFELEAEASGTYLVGCATETGDTSSERVAAGENDVEITLRLG